MDDETFGDFLDFPTIANFKKDIINAVVMLHDDEQPKEDVAVELAKIIKDITYFERDLMIRLTKKLPNQND